MNNQLRNRILRTSLEYTRILGKLQPYKIQFMAIYNYFSKPSRVKLTRHNVSYYASPITGEHKKDCEYIRDLLYKNDYMTPRMAVLIRPKIYAYYTFQTFMYIFKTILSQSSEQKLDFSTKHIKVFYAGFLELKRNNLKENATYIKSYNDFQEYRTKFQGSRVLKIDIQNFFVGITAERLQHALLRLCKKEGVNATQEINNIINFMHYSGYTSLPQSRALLASSILSQIYLIRFTDSLETIAVKYNIHIVRYVDDMYIQLPQKMHNRDVNNLINIISSELWKDGLNLNSKKVKIFSVEGYKRNTNWAITNNSTYNTKFKVSIYIQDKINSLLDNNGENLLEFWNSVHNLWNAKGNDMEKYLKIADNYLSIKKDDTNKIMNNLIFGNQWKNRLDLSAKKALISFPEIMTFDPVKYVTFLTLIESNIKLLDKNYKSTPVGDYIKIMHNQLDAVSYTIRQGLIDSNYFVQVKNSSVIDNGNLQELNSNYTEFIYRYILAPNKKTLGVNSSGKMHAQKGD